MLNPRVFVALACFACWASLFQTVDRGTDTDTIVALRRDLHRLQNQLQDLQQQNMMPAVSPTLPTCIDLMKSPSLANGDFLSRSEVNWVPRHDGSRRLELPHTCRLHRYTAPEARMCLKGTHINIIGDSLSRYLSLSLVHFIHRGAYPAHFKRAPPNEPCPHMDEHGNATCSIDPNLCAEGDWRIGNPTKDSWLWLQGMIGGWTDGGLFDGHMECSCGRPDQCQHRDKARCTTENTLYRSPTGNITLSYFSQAGWGDNMTPIKGFNFTGCGKTGKCRRTVDQATSFTNRAAALDFDFEQPLEEALDGVLRDIMPPADVTIFNRGLWGILKGNVAERLLPKFKDFVSKKNGRCFYRTTTTSPRSREINEAEESEVDRAAMKSGCSVLDFSHLTRPFAGYQHYGLAEKKTIATPATERRLVYWDALHFQPWVYEELNNLMLNVLCNAKRKP